MDERIREEIERLNEIFTNISENKKTLCAKLIQNAAFMAVTLEDLQETIMDEGAVKEFTNGNGFTILQEHPAQKSYNTMINRYASVMRQLQDLLPDKKEDAVFNAGEALAAFVAKGKPGGK